MGADRRIIHTIAPTKRRYGTPNFETPVLLRCIGQQVTSLISALKFDLIYNGLFVSPDSMIVLNFQAVHLINGLFGIFFNFVQWSCQPA